jgi:DNA (cytosine-5)-methyltransferase 1
MPSLTPQNEFTFGEICAGIGGFGLGFTRAGWQGSWSIELDDVNRAVLADRFPESILFKNLCHWTQFIRQLKRVHAILFGFPCQDLSVMGQHRGVVRGLAGPRSGLFFTIMDIVRVLQPPWLVIENVPGLLVSNGGQDFQTVLQTLTDCGYCGFFRVLDAQYFGVPQKRRRVFLVFGLGRFPSMDFLADAAAVEGLSCSCESGPRHHSGWAGYTLTAPAKSGKNVSRARINMCSEILVAEEDGWGQMVERARAAEVSRVPPGLDETNLAEAYAAGNAVCPEIAEWIAGILKRS